MALRKPKPAMRTATAVLLAFGMWSLAGAGTPAGAAETQQPLEYRVKAAFLLNFTKFVEWPPIESGGSDAFNVCIFGDDPFGLALDQIVEGETVNGRKLAIVRIRQNTGTSCPVLFVGKLEKDVRQTLSGFGRGVLTVGEGDGFLRDGGMIAFVVENRRVRFDVSLGAASNAALKISSKLLSVARTVEK